MKDQFLNLIYFFIDSKLLLGDYYFSLSIIEWPLLNLFCARHYSTLRCRARIRLEGAEKKGATSEAGFKTVVFTLRSLLQDLPFRLRRRIRRRQMGRREQKRCP